MDELCPDARERPIRRGATGASERGTERSALLRRLADRALSPAEVEQLVPEVSGLAGDHRAALALLLHPSLREPSAERFAARLPWRTLALAATSPMCLPARRRSIERRLVEGVPRLTHGERVALARLATEPVLRALAGAGPARVRRAVATAPRATTALRMELTPGSSTPPSSAPENDHPENSGPTTFRIDPPEQPRGPR